MKTAYRIYLMLVVVAAVLAACGASASPVATPVPLEPPTSTTVPAATTPLPPTLSPDVKSGISNLRFATRQDLTNAQGDGAIFDVGVPHVWVAVDYRDLPPNTDLIWRIDGGNIEGTRKKQALADTAGRVVFDLFSGGRTVLPGDYRVTVRTNKQALTAAFSVSADRLETGELIVSDQFYTNTLGWDLSATPLGYSKIVDGRLLLAVKWKEQRISTAAPFGLSDFDLSVDVAHEQGPATGYASIWFRGSYSLDMFPNGAIVVFQFNDNDISKLFEAAPEPSYQPFGFNRLRIVASGDQLAFYRNDVLLTTVTQANQADANIVLAASTLETGKLVVSFDNLEVRVPAAPPAKTSRR